MLSAMSNEDYIAKTHHYTLARYRRENKTTRHHEESKPVNEIYRENIRKMIEICVLPVCYVAKFKATADTLCQR